MFMGFLRRLLAANFDRRLHGLFRFAKMVLPGTEHQRHRFQSLEPEPQRCKGIPMTESANKAIHPAIEAITGGASLAFLARAFRDWATHLAASPSKQMELVAKSLGNSVRLANCVWHCAANGEKAERSSAPLAQDPRFASETWQKWPFNFAAQAFLLNQQWWHAAATGG
jgi:polyhydroxyalkanoate synthase